MQVKELLQNKQKEIITVSSSTGILKAMELLIGNKISCLPVIDPNNRLVGIISDKDIFKAVYENRKEFAVFTVEQLMTTDLLVGLEDDDIEYISNIMTNNRIRHVPIVDDDRLVGLISIGDVVMAKQDHIEIENRYLKQYIDGTYPA